MSVTQVPKKPLPGMAVDGMDPIRSFLVDDDVSEVMINGPGSIWIERFGALQRTDADIDRQELELLIERIMTPLGLRVDRASPIVDARMADGSRVNVVVPPLAIDGPLLSIRRFGSTPVSLSAFGPPDLSRLLGRLMADRASVLVAGPTSSGKTTLINALSELVNPAERVVCIEDTAELRLAGNNVVRLEARPPNSEGVGEVSLRQLVLTALRMRPDRLVVGEVRGAEAFDLLLALTSGHSGCLTSCHAADAPSALRRLETLASLAGHQLGSARLQRLIADGLDVVITTDRIGHRRLIQSVVAAHGGRLQVLWAAETAAKTDPNDDSNADTIDDPDPDSSRDSIDDPNHDSIDDPVRHLWPAPVTAAAPPVVEIRRARSVGQRASA